MTRLLDRLSVSRRLLTISAAFTLPIGVMLFLLVAGINQDITFVQLEMDGNTYQRPLEAILDGLSDHRRAGIELADGDVRAGDRVRESEVRVERAFEALAEVDGRLGTALQFTPDGLAQRKREHVRVATVRQEWQALKGSSTQEGFAAAHAHLTGDIRTMITHAGDTSNLILDPDLDSYYTMDMTLLAIPQTQVRITAIIELAQGLAARRAITAAERIQLAVAAASLQEADLDRIVADADTALNEDGRFHGSSETLGRNLPPAVDAYRQQVQALIEATTAVVQAPAVFDAGTVVAAGAKARTASSHLWRVAADELDRLLAARAGSLRQAQLWALGLSAVAWASALAIVFVIARSISRPLLATSVALGDSAEGVLHAAQELSRASQSLSKGATEQAASIEETSASMEEMASMTRKNAENSQAAAALMGDVDGRVRESNAALDGMVTSMKSIQDSSQQVAKIIKTIDEIAFQTNILALNAAVEAARAGEAGMGFAVVADEVRNLAQRSAKAAKDTAALIEASIAKIDGGSQNVTHVSQSISAITESVTKVKGLVEEVSLASRQQTQGIEQVSQAISQMEKVTQTTAATAEESAAASEQLTAQADSAMGVVAGLTVLVGVARARAAGHKPAVRRAAPAAPVVRIGAGPTEPWTSDADSTMSGDATGTYGRF